MYSTKKEKHSLAKKLIQQTNKDNLKFSRILFGKGPGGWDSWDSWDGWDGWDSWDSWDQQINRQIKA